MADFTGFYLGGIHSSTYGILRVSDGDRYSEGLVPEFDNMELELSGGNGDLYGGKKFKKTSFEIKIAFEHLTEKQFREMRNWLGRTELQSFRFDERPYKTYWVTLASRPELEYVCFMEEREDGLIGEKERIYKGEGELEFVAYSPFGYCIDESTKLTYNGLEINEGGVNWQILNNYSPFNIIDDNMVEWGETSGLKNSLKDYNVFNMEEDAETWEYNAKLYNPGDFNADFELLIDLEDATKIQVIKGDFNGDGHIGSEDCIALQRYVSGTTEQPGYDFTYADLNKDGVIDDEDVIFAGKLNSGILVPEIIEQEIELALDKRLITINIIDSQEKRSFFQFSVNNLNSKDKIILNSKKHSLEIYSLQGTTYSKSLRYDLVKSTNWITIPQGESRIKIECGIQGLKPQIKYNYKYY